MINDRFKKQLEFIKEVDKIKEILRVSVKWASKERENDAEHSWHLALMVPVLNEYMPWDVDLFKVMRLVTIHDIVEIDAGDTYCFDTKGYEDKNDREEAAAKRIFGLLPEDQYEEFYSLWREFEEGKTPEARYANVLDRLQPLILSNSTKGENWIKYGNTKSQVLSRMGIIKDISETLWAYVEESVENGIKNGWLKNE